MMKLAVTIDEYTTIEIAETNLILTNQQIADKNKILFGFNKRSIKQIADNLSTEYDEIWSLTGFSNKESLIYNLREKTIENGVKLEKYDIAMFDNPVSSDEALEIITVLEQFGYSFKKKKPAKAQHRWSKEIADIDFYVDYNDAKATCKWQKRNQLLIKKGAILKKETPLNKDGSLGFAAKFSLALRDQHSEAINDFITTEDIVLKSVNEAGNFLYFAGTNSWLILKDKDGKSINDYSVIK